MNLILYSKPGCHLCEGLQEKLEEILKDPENPCKFYLEIRDITTRDDWFAAYQYEVPVLSVCEADTTTEQFIPRPSPRISVRKLQQMLQKYFSTINN
ncbi:MULTISPECIES: glutaredoxin family protein [Okeania]|uniref:Glutaredoxin family protein n=1 Tax=Okeania hirsuta TaxID=1458930 RepID=A0A3N6QMS0_9CYAN|nr:MULTISPECIES: glutaredoxin family protein [Okeania]NES88507.1 glutaredoxin family protein [Okeania sp. SIO2B9]NET74552.1 glutaredoxin family protein [Okeania sp. SIO1F9]RQH21757.1 glutaredoxin family protein [Okeania hirsuta]RQH45947.1 glutaredoxin family protein [Okeania hirsuta]